MDCKYRISDSQSPNLLGMRQGSIASIIDIGFTMNLLHAASIFRPEIDISNQRNRRRRENPLVRAFVVIPNYIVPRSHFDSGFGGANFQIDRLTFMLSVRNRLPLLQLASLLFLVDMAQRRKTFNIFTIL